MSASPDFFTERAPPFTFLKEFAKPPDEAGGLGIVNVES
jgi:hypothetical protein